MRYFSEKAVKIAETLGGSQTPFGLRRLEASPQSLRYCSHLLLWLFHRAFLHLIGIEKDQSNNTKCSAFASPA